MSIGDHWHRGMGLWAFETCNASSWKSLLDHALARSTADVLLAQETCIRGTDQISAASIAAGGKGWAACIGDAATLDSGWASGGCAVLASGGIGVSTSRNALVSEELRSRVQHALVGCALKGGIHCISIYLRDCVGIAANLDLLLEVAALVKTLEGPWIIGGDFLTTRHRRWPTPTGPRCLAVRLPRLALPPAMAKHMTSSSSPMRWHLL